MPLKVARCKCWLLINCISTLHLNLKLIFHSLFYREKKKELEREELWRKLEELKLKKAMVEKQNSTHNVLNAHNTSAK